MRKFWRLNSVAQNGAWDEMRSALVLVAAMSLPGCAADAPGGSLMIATITSSYTFGGEALFSGKLVMRNGCLVASVNTGFATAVFDPGVTLAADGSTINDVRHNVQVPIGRPFQAGSAWMRGDGQGWAVRDIEAFFGTRIPPGCPTDDVVRLHDFVIMREGGTMAKSLSTLAVRADGRQ